MKKIVSLLMALAMIFSLSAVAFANETTQQPQVTTQSGSITINGVSADTTYSIYRLLDLESFSADGKAYSYKVNSDWARFFAAAVTNEAGEVTAEAGPGNEYVTIDAAGYVTWAKGEDDATMAAFAKLALQYAKHNGIDPVKSSANEGEFVITDAVGKFSDLPLGWYLVDSTAGALCGLTTTDPDASVNAKNHTPTIDKQVQEDLTGMWGDTNTADIGQIVNYMSIIHVAAGAENYVLHDKMSDGLTFEQNLSDPNNLRGVTVIKHVNSLGVESTLVKDTDYIVKTTGLCEDCTFEVEFVDSFVESLKPNDRILVYYNAMLNRNAVVGPEGEDKHGNPNESWLEYGEEKYTTHDATKTYTFSIDIVKTDSSNKLINGAEFKIYNAATGGEEVGVVPLLDADEETPVLDDKGNPMYRRARADEVANQKTVPIVVKDGKVTVVGFDNGVYYLEETKAPEGYNKLTARQEFTIADANLDSIFNENIFSTGSGVHVVNKTGNMLPETGAMGTMLFITFGTLVVLGTGVLLVTKKRMSMIVE